MKQQIPKCKYITTTIFALFTIHNLTYKQKQKYLLEKTIALTIF